MKRNFLNSFLLSLLGVGFLVNSCDKGIIGKRESHFNISPKYYSDNLMLISDIDSLEVNITSNSYWEVTNKDENKWLSISPKSGNGNQTVKVKAEKNDKLNTRTSTLYFQSYEIIDSLEITQKGSGITLSKSAYNDVSSKGEKLELILNSVLDWKTIAEASASWIKLNKTTGEKGEYKISVIIDENKKVETRTDSILFISKNEENKIYLKIRQLSPKASLKAQADVNLFSSKSGSFVIHLDTNIEYDISSSLEGVVFSDLNKSDNTISVTYPANEESKTRSFIVEIKGKSPKDDIVQILNFKQTKKGSDEIIFSINTDSFEDIVSDGLNTDLKLIAQAEWILSNSKTANWINTDITKGKIGVNELKFEILANKTEKIRVDSILISATNNPSIKKWIKFTQQAFVPVFTLEFKNDKIPADKNTFDISIKSNINWELKSNIENLSFSTNKGLASDKIQIITVTCPKNENKDSRDILISLLGLNDFASHKSELNVVQDGKTAVSIIVEEENITIGGFMQIFTIKLKSSNVDWVIVSKSSKFNIVNITEGKATDTPVEIKVNASANRSLIALDGRIEIQNKADASIKKVITITQKIHPMNDETFVYSNPELTAKQLGLTKYTVHPTVKKWKFWNAQEFTKGAAGFWTFDTKLGSQNAILTTDNSVVKNGSLKLITTKLPAKIKNRHGEDAYYKSCALYTKRYHQPNPWVKFTQNMRIEVRYRNSGDIGFNDAIWLMGQSNYHGDKIKWPDCGELDILEMPYKNQAHFTLHTKNYSSVSHNSVSKVIRIADETKWNIYWVEILEDKIRGGINGVKYFEHVKGSNGNSDWPWSDERGFMMILTPGIGAWNPQMPVITGNQESFMELDWIRVYVNDKFDESSQSGHVGNFY